MEHLLEDENRAWHYYSKIAPGSFARMGTLRPQLLFFGFFEDKMGTTWHSYDRIIPMSKLMEWMRHGFKYVTKIFFVIILILLDSADQHNQLLCDKISQLKTWFGFDQETAYELRFFSVILGRSWDRTRRPSAKSNAERIFCHLRQTVQRRSRHIWFLTQKDFSINYGKIIRIIRKIIKTRTGIGNRY